MSKLVKSLSLDPWAVERGERYSKHHSTSLSRLVSDFLSRLPVDEDRGEEMLTPAVRRLLGVASGGTDREDYRMRLLEKYGR